MLMIRHQLDAAHTARSLCPSAGLQLKALLETLAPATLCLRPPTTVATRHRVPHGGT